MRLSRRYAATAAAFGIALAGLVATQAPVEADKACTVRTNDSVRKVLNCVTLDGVLEHEQAFQDIADANGGIRSVGTPGYAASADYVEDRLTAAGYVVTRQTFDVFAFEEIGPDRAGADQPDPHDVRRRHRLRRDAAVRAGRRHGARDAGRHPARARQHLDQRVRGL